MRVLLTGARGFIGRHLMDALPKEWTLYTPPHDGMWGGVPREFELGIHLAGQSDPADSVGRPGYDLDANAGFTIRLLHTLKFKRFIFMSSGAVYDGLARSVTPQADINPTLPYAISKLAAERYCEFFRRQGRIKSLTIVRFFGAYGPGEPERKIYSRLVRQFGIDRKPEFTIRGDGANLIDAMYIDDAARALAAIAKRRPSETIIDLAAHDPRTITALVKRAGDVFNITPKIKYEGKSAEPIAFHSIDRSFAFTPRVTLEDGLQRLKAWMESR